MRSLLVIVCLLVACGPPPAEVATAPAAVDEAACTGTSRTDRVRFEEVEFAPGSAELDEEARDVIAANAALLVRCPSLGIWVRAVADPCSDPGGPPGYALRLSGARADAVAFAYIASGIPRARLERVEGGGSYQRNMICYDESPDPFADHRTASTWVITPDVRAKWARTDSSLIRYLAADHTFFARLPTLDCSDTQDLNSVYFAPDSSELSEEARRRLHQNAAILAKCDDIDVVLHAYTDNCESDQLALSEARAREVERYLIEKGAPPDQILRTLGMGEDPGHGTPCPPPGHGDGDTWARRGDVVPVWPSYLWSHENPGVRPADMPDSLRRADSLWFGTRRSRR